MATKKFACLILILYFSNGVQSASLLERSYEYFVNLGKSWAPSLMSFMDCMGEDDPFSCAKEKAGKMLDVWDEKNQEQRRSWQEAADAEVTASGRSLDQMPSKIGKQVEDSLNSLAEIVGNGVARALAKKHDSGGGIDSITISTGGEKKKMKKKKQKPPKIHLVQPMMVAPMQKADKGRGFDSSKVQSWVIGEEAKSAIARNSSRRGRGLVSDFWDLGEAALDAAAEHAMKSDEKDDGVADKSSLEEQRGKKKKKKKAILKLLILGAVLKAKIGTLLQILSFKLQVIYYEHAQHQHHYDHEEDHGWGPWSRSIAPEETADLEDLPASPFHAQERTDVQYRPLLTKD
ncbi:hypothetical protein ABMA27_010853 [Loxostege sticticalis]|uniref:Uncharacterized protein n=1 Tax=Loxostege sticticalis TaxID=481309 RepID=A0ABR3H2F6_LOXSC